MTYDEDNGSVHPKGFTVTIGPVGYNGQTLKVTKWFNPYLADDGRTQLFLTREAIKACIRELERGIMDDEVLRGLMGEHSR